MRGIGFGTKGITLTYFETNSISQKQDGGHEEPRITVEAEDPPERLLLETRISKEDGFQKQQGTRDDEVGGNIAADRQHQIP
jgi:hypothetical protein